MLRDEIQLTDGAISIRPYQKSDIPAIYAAVRESMEHLMPRMRWCHAHYAIEETQAWVATLPEAWAQGSQYDFAILAVHDDNFLGGCGLDQVDLEKGWANLGYWVRTSHTRRGVATAAARLGS